MAKTLLAVSVTTDWTAADVVRQPALDLARPRLGEEAQRQPLEVRVQRVAQVLHHALADDVVEVRLADADEARDDRDDDHQAGVEVEQPEVLLRDRLVDEQLEQVRVDEPEQARDDDREQDRGDRHAVRPEEAGDPADGPVALLLRHLRAVRSRRTCCPWIP